jgi:alpha/beta superfamily hydrolase
VPRPPFAERLNLAGRAGDLEALIEIPLGEAAPQSVSSFAVVCHPHPLYGGTLDNKVVWALARAFQQLGAATIRFNFRGVGASAASYDAGSGETADALAVAAYGRARWPHSSLWLAGFSFGAVVALRAAAEARPQRLVAVAPGITTIELGEASAPACPWLIVQGDADEVVPAEAVLAWAHKLSPAPELVVLPGASHFFHGRINELREAVLAFMQRA